MTPIRFGRRRLLQAGLPLIMLGRAKGAAQGKGRTIALGFDGVDPRLLERFIRAGDLPRAAALARKGAFSPLGSSSPPNSPVAWTSFATGLEPGEHGVFGFLQRNPSTYLPGTAAYTVTGPRRVAGSVIPPKATSHHRGTTFAELLDRAGVSTSLLWVPYLYPPPELRNGRVFAGQGASDLRFTNSSFTFFTSESGVLREPGGGRVVELSGASRRFETALEGPLVDGAALTTPLTLEVDRPAGRITIELGGRRETIALGQWSAHFPVRWTLGDLPLWGRVRFFLIEVRANLRLYASPIELDPAAPALPMGAPPDWFEAAVRQHKLPVLGWLHDTSAVVAGALPREAFLADTLAVMEAQASLVLAELGGPSELITAVFTSTDRAAHIFYRELERPDGGPLRLVYRLMDRIIGLVQDRLRPADRLLILSDHGFHPFERMLHVNTWLEAEGLLTRRAPDATVNLLQGMDWSRTQVYGLGEGQLYLNLKGREGQGIVVPGQQVEALLKRIEARAVELRDPGSGERPVRAVYRVAEVANASLRDRAPDLQLSFTPGWRSSWESTLGGAPPGSPFALNTKAWCGDHAASDYKQTPGVLLSNVPIAIAEPRLIDFKNSFLLAHGLPAEGPGRKLW